MYSILNNNIDVGSKDIFQMTIKQKLPKQFL